MCRLISVHIPFNICHVNFSRADMNFVHYKWPLRSSIVQSSDLREPGRGYFDPFNGEQVLYMINLCLTCMQSLPLKDARDIKNKIAFRFPDEIVSEKFVYR